MNPSIPPVSNLPVFERLRFVLVETSRPGNIGAAARAMKTMGFSELFLVAPREADALHHEEAIAFASGANDVLSQARIVDSLDEALSGCNLTVALSARLREFSPPLRSPRALAQQLHADTGLRCALVFGNERFGLSNEQVEKCNALVSIPVSAEYASLNLAQAVQILAYECRVAEMGEQREAMPIGFQGEAASAEQIEGLFRHLEQALIEIEFLDPDHPKKLMPRLRRLFSRTGLETEEVNILRGIATQIIERRKRLK
ncbi:MAG: tRNA:Cm32/Um32 methyltransferase [Pseudomonadota bacterium]|jgi:tRNA/rRNA methyltransferase